MDSVVFQRLYAKIWSSYGAAIRAYRLAYDTFSFSSRRYSLHVTPAPGRRALHHATRLQQTIHMHPSARPHALRASVSDLRRKQSLRRRNGVRIVT
jgi:hypothetical protein